MSRVFAYILTVAVRLRVPLTATVDLDSSVLRHFRERDPFPRVPAVRPPRRLQSPVDS